MVEEHAALGLGVLGLGLPEHRKQPEHGICVARLGSSNPCHCPHTLPPWTGGL
jgi:hypothetical protein